MAARGHWSALVAFTRRCVRARNRLRVVAPLPFAYNFWIRNIERPLQLGERASEAIGSWESKPTFAIVIDARLCTSQALTRSIRSVERQVYADWTVFVIAGDPNCAAAHAPLKNATSVMSALDHCSAEFFVPLIGGDQLSRGAPCSILRKPCGLNLLRWSSSAMRMSSTKRVPGDGLGLALLE